MGFLLPTLPQGAGREGAGAPACRPREEHQSRHGGGGRIPHLMPVLLIRDVYPGSLIPIFIHTGSRISTIFCSHNIIKLEIFLGLNR